MLNPSRCRVLIGSIDESYEGMNVEICGFIVDMGISHELGLCDNGLGGIAREYLLDVYYDACPTCKKALERVDKGYNCKSCGAVKESKPRMLYKITLDDGSGAMKATLFDSVGEKLLGMTAEEAKKLITKSDLDDEDIHASLNKNLGIFITIQGRIIKSNNSIELSSNGFEYADPNQEIKRPVEDTNKETT